MIVIEVRTSIKEHTDEMTEFFAQSSHHPLAAWKVATNSSDSAPEMFIVLPRIRVNVG
jgi:hypothetical protein